MGSGEESRAQPARGTADEQGHTDGRRGTVVTRQGRAHCLSPSVDGGLTTPYLSVARSCTRPGAGCLAVQGTTDHLHLPPHPHPTPTGPGTVLAPFTCFNPKQNGVRLYSSTAPPAPSSAGLALHQLVRYSEGPGPVRSQEDRNGACLLFGMWGQPS